MADNNDNNSLGNNQEHLLGEEPYNYETFPDDDIQSISTESSANEEFSVINKKQKNKKSNKKKDDRGYRKIKGKEGKFEYFATSIIPGLYIRDPIYGRHMDNHRVGSTDEDLYFKVTYIANGVNEPDHLYYDNPEQFESHMNCNIKAETKQIWADKYQIALRNMEKAN